MEKAQLKGMFASGNMPVGAEYKAALNDVLQAFPYFQLAQVLYAKQMYDTHEPEASGRIKLASVYAPDRKAMYLLFKQLPIEEKSVKPTTPIVEKKAKEDVKYNFVYSSTTTENAKVTNAPTKEEVKETSLPEIFIRKELEAKSPVPPSTQKPVKVDPPKVEVKKEEIKKVETPNIPVKKAYVPPSIAIEDKKVSEKKTEEIIPVVSAEPVSKDKAEEKKTEPEKPLVPEAEVPIVVNEPITDSNLKYSFSSWLHVIPEISVEKKEATKPISQEKTADIIDNFLKKAPSMSRPKAEFFSPTKAAKQSITEDDTIISETLAKIYVTQGNLQRALKAYQTLLLQFPEKKNIFAARIEEIKALIRENTKPGTK